jgi:hypothetical protein
VRYRKPWLVIPLTTDYFCEGTTTRIAALAVLVAVGTRDRSVLRMKNRPDPCLLLPVPVLYRYVNALQPRGTRRAEPVIESQYVAWREVTLFEGILSKQLVRSTRPSLCAAESAQDTCGHSRVVDIEVVGVAGENPRGVWPVDVCIQKHGTAPDGRQLDDSCHLGHFSRCLSRKRHGVHVFATALRCGETKIEDTCPQVIVGKLFLGGRFGVVDNEQATGGCSGTGDEWHVTRMHAGRERGRTSQEWEQHPDLNCT